jgi:hypothetical protein
MAAKETGRESRLLRFDGGASATLVMEPSEEIKQTGLSD